MNAPQGHKIHIKSTTTHERLCGNKHNATKLLLVNAAVAQQGLECINAKVV
jgi:hypothetical protein